MNAILILIAAVVCAVFLARCMARVIRIMFEGLRT